MKIFILMGFFALAMLLGSGCKKEEPAKQKSSAEAFKEAPKANWLNDTHTSNTEDGGGGTGGTPDPWVWPNFYPHNTGVCPCAPCVNARNPAPTAGQGGLPYPNPSPTPITGGESGQIPPPNN